MIDLTKAILPSAVLVDGRYFTIHTDFHYWITFYRILKNNAKPLVTDFDFLYTEKIPENRQSGFQQLLAFYNQRSALPRPTGKKSDGPLYDFDIDSDLIYSAFYEQYKIDLVSETHLHWFKFLALFNGLRETKLNDVMGYRAFDKNNKNGYEKEMEEMKKAWQIETALTAKEKADLEEFDSLLK